MKRKLKKRHRTIINRATQLPLAALISLACSTPAFAGMMPIFNTYPGLGTLGGGSSYANGISADGSVVVGSSTSGGGGAPHAFRWTTAGGMSNLGTLGGLESYAYGVSADGSVIVGLSSNAGGLYDAFRWTAANGMTDLGTLGGTFSAAYAVSADGSVVVGEAQKAGGISHAFRWTGGTMTDLGVLGTVNLGIMGFYDLSTANGVSADGSVVVGVSSINGVMATHAFRWTQAGGMSDLGTLGGGWSCANAVSADGSVVVGESYTTGAGDWNAFRWTQAGGMSTLGTLGGSNSYANGISANGSVVVGSSEYAVGNANTLAFRWTQPTGMQKVTDWLAGAGISVTPGWVLTSATGVSGNGNVVVGNGTNPSGANEAWLARVDSAGSGLLTDIPAYNSTLVEAGSRAVQAGAGLSNLALFGAHHRSILDFNLARGANGLGGWVVSDVAGYNTGNTQTELIEAGVSVDAGGVRLGLGGGQVWSRQDWSLGGSSKYDGHYLLAEIAGKLGAGFEGSMLGYYGLFNTTLNRNYLNGANVDTSIGKPDADAVGIRARVDWRDALKLDKVSFSPYLAYTWLQTNLDGYTEISGGFPAVFNAARWETSDLRCGVATKAPITDDLDLRVAVEGIQRLDTNSEGMSGSVIGLWDFNLSGQSTEQNWVRGIVDLDYHITKATLINLSANTATNGGDPTWGVSLGIRASF